MALVNYRHDDLIIDIKVFHAYKNEAGEWQLTTEVAELQHAKYDLRRLRNSYALVVSGHTEDVRFTFEGHDYTGEDEIAGWRYVGKRHDGTKLNLLIIND